MRQSGGGWKRDRGGQGVVRGFTGWAGGTLAAGLIACIIGAAGSTAAEEMAPERVALWGFVSEVRVSVANHDVDFIDLRGDITLDPFSHDVEDGLDIGGELLFTAPEGLAFLGSPRPHIGFGLSTAGQTNHAYAGLTWGYTFEPGFFAEGFLGLAVHDGYIHDEDAPEDRLALGSPVLFRFGADLGWRFDNGFGVSLFWEHMSTGAILGDSDENPAMDNVGLRIGYRFD